MAISADYTIGEPLKIKLFEHEYVTPPVPQKKQIIFHNLPKKEQFWSREKVIADIPSFFFEWNKDVIEDAAHTTYDGKRLISLSVKDTALLIECRDREIRRIIDGFWFFNNGQPTYITGGHYGVLVWGAMVDSLNDVEERSLYGKYMRFQRDYCYFIEICKTTPYASGGDVVKPKKTGITMLQALLVLMEAITHKTSFYRIMSTKEEVAKKINFFYISYALEKLPAILTPEYRKNLGAVYFENSDTSAKRSSRRKTDVEFLNSGIETVATIDNGFDSGKNKIAWCDEESKIRDGAYPQSLHNATIPTVNQGLLRVGYVIYTHYVSEKNDRSFREARKIFFESLLKSIDSTTGKTKSKLLAYPMFVQDGIFGACDKYGDPELDKIWAEINSQHASKKDDPAALRAYRRQMPTSLDDVWQEGAGEASIFDNYRLGVQLNELTKDESYGAYSFMDFNFQWSKPPEIDEIRGIYKFEGKPVVVPVTNKQKMNGKEHGLFKWYMPQWAPTWWLEKHLNKTTIDQKGKLCPNPASPFYIAVDPTQYSQAKDVVVASKNAVQVFVLPDAELDGYFKEKVTNKRLMVEYLHRPDSPKDTLIHVVQTILYFGCYVLIECNANWLATRLKEWGLGNFLIVVNKDTGILEPYKEYSDQKPFTSQRSDRGGFDTIDWYVTAGKIHLAEAFSGVDNTKYIHSVEVITQLMNFDPENTREYDAAVCYLIGLLGINTFLGWRQREMERLSRKGDPLIRQLAIGVMN